LQPVHTTFFLSPQASRTYDSRYVDTSAWYLRELRKARAESKGSRLTTPTWAALSVLSFRVYPSVLVSKTVPGSFPGMGAW
jgi:hypothetical protein